MELADIRHLERVFAANTTDRGEDSVSVIFVAIRLLGTRQDVVHPVGDSAIEEVAIHIRKALRGGRPTLSVRLERSSSPVEPGGRANSRS